MKNLILFEGDARENLLPLTFTRPAAELRVGILTIREKWEHWLSAKASFITEEYLTQKYPIHIEDDNYVVNGSVLPEATLVAQILALENNEAL